MKKGGFGRLFLAARGKRIVSKPPSRPSQFVNSTVVGLKPPKDFRLIGTTLSTRVDLALNVGVQALPGLLCDGSFGP